MGAVSGPAGCLCMGEYHEEHIWYSKKCTTTKVTLKKKTLSPFDRESPSKKKGVLVCWKKQVESGLTCDTVSVLDCSCLRHCHIQKGTQTL